MRTVAELTASALSVIDRAFTTPATYERRGVVRHKYANVHEEPTMPKKPTITEAERLRHQCPTCWATPGEPCIDPKRDATPRCHRTRGPGQLEAHAGKRAERVNARAMASYGPLFQETAQAEVKPLTALDVIQKQRQDAAHAPDFEGYTGPHTPPARGLEWIRLRHICDVFEQLAGPEFGQGLRERVTGKWGGIEHGIDRMRSVLTTTEPYEVKHELRFDPARVNKINTDGRHLVCTLLWAPAAPLMTREEFDARFKINHHKGLVDAPEPDDGGLFERTIGAMNH